MERVCGGTDIRLKRGVVIDRTYITHDKKTNVYNDGGGNGGGADDAETTHGKEGRGL